VKCVLFGGPEDGAEYEFPSAPPAIRVLDPATRERQAAVPGCHVYEPEVLTEERAADSEALGVRIYRWNRWEEFWKELPRPKRRSTKSSRR